MARVSKFTEEQKFEIALDLVRGKLSHAEICRKYGISSTYAYKLRDRVLIASAGDYVSCFCLDQSDLFCGN